MYRSSDDDGREGQTVEPIFSGHHLSVLTKISVLKNRVLQRGVFATRYFSSLLKHHCHSLILRPFDGKDCEATGFWLRERTACMAENVHCKKKNEYLGLALLHSTYLPSLFAYLTLPVARPQIPISRY